MIDRQFLRRVRREASNRLGARRYAQASKAVSDLSAGTVLVYFAATPGELYQLDQWVRPLTRLAERHPVAIVVNQPDIGRLAERLADFPVVFARSGAQLERLVEECSAAAVLYLNHREANFRMLRMATIPHIYLGHGESDKSASASHHNMAYDFCFVAGEAGRERLAAAMPMFDARQRAPVIGRPQLDDPLLATPDVVDRPGSGADGPRTVLYAPTWEGAMPSMSVSSLTTHGPALVDAVLTRPDWRLVYRPHPLTGSVSRAHRTADERIRARLERVGAPHRIDTGPYLATLGRADVAVVDISSVAYDWLATGRPLVVTEPADGRARPTESELLSGAPRLPAHAAGSVVDLLDSLREPDPAWTGLVRRHLGETTPGASTAAFIAAVDAAIALVRRHSP